MKRTFALIMVAMMAVGCFAQLPSVTLKNIDGKTVNTAKLNNDGKPFIISFFATWCKPCQRELDAIHEQIVDWEEETGVKVIAVSIDQGQNVDKVKPLVDSKGWEYEVLLDPNGDFKRAMNVQNVPHVFVLDGNGKIVYNHAGYTEGGEQDIYDALQ